MVYHVGVNKGIFGVSYENYPDVIGHGKTMDLAIDDLNKHRKHKREVRMTTSNSNPKNARIAIIGVILSIGFILLLTASPAIIRMFAE